MEATCNAYNQRQQVAQRNEHFSRFGIFMFIHNYHVNWVDEERGRMFPLVQRAMLDILFHLWTRAGLT
ncbi:MAG: hypothetical protein IPK53_03365 [bacterium]|nr:hypothetical protein [bacterium]